MYGVAGFQGLRGADGGESGREAGRKGLGIMDVQKDGERILGAERARHCWCCVIWGWGRCWRIARVRSEGGLRRRDLRRVWLSMLIVSFCVCEVVVVLQLQALTMSNVQCAVVVQQLFPHAKLSCRDPASGNFSDARNAALCWFGRAEVYGYMTICDLMAPAEHSVSLYIHSFALTFL